MPAALDRYVGTFVAALAVAGVRHAVIAPGSRSTPLTLALTAPQSGITPWLHLDERSAAYFALGIARQLDQPVAIVCTSGTAAANFLPAVVEARLSRVPLIVLTADRPPELRDVGAPQSIDQVRIFGSHAKWAVDMPLAEDGVSLDQPAPAPAPAPAASAASPENSVAASPENSVVASLDNSAPAPAASAASPDNSVAASLENPLAASLDNPTAAALNNYAAATAVRAVTLSREAPAGPVHLNFPFREPLVDSTSVEQVTLPAAISLPGSLEVTPSRLVPAQALIAALTARLVGRKGLIVAGPESSGLPAPAIVALADLLGWPIVADPLSGLRTGPHDLTRVIDRADVLAREPAFTARAEPAVVLRFGAAPTSKPLNLWLAALQHLDRVIVDGAAAGTAGFRDPESLAATVVRSDPTLLCQLLLAAHPSTAASSAPDPAWSALWTEANHAATEAIDTAIDALDEPFEGSAPRDLAAMLPDGATLVVGNSMPVRDVDSFFPTGPRHVRLLGTRGASGIDGVVSTAAGAAAAARKDDLASAAAVAQANTAAGAAAVARADGAAGAAAAGLGAPVALLIGDLSFFHDQNGLWPVTRHNLDLTIVLVNNDGGGIFEFLPQQQLVGDRFEPWFGTPHGLDFTHTVAQYGGRHQLLDRDPRAAIAEALARPGLDVLELRTDRSRNVALHRQVFAAATAAIRAALESTPEATTAPAR